MKPQVVWSANPVGPHQMVLHLRYQQPSYTVLDGKKKVTVPELTHGITAGGDMVYCPALLLEWMQDMAQRLVKRHPLAQPALLSLLDFVPLQVTSLNKLPVVIRGPGLYRMRNGGYAHIHQVRPFVDPEGKKDRLEVTAFEAKGARYKFFRGKLRQRGYDIWHVSGRVSVFKEHNMDIVEKLPADFCIDEEERPCVS